MKILHNFLLASGLCILLLPACHPTPAEVLHQERITRDSLALVTAQAQADSAEALSAETVESMEVQSPLPTTASADSSGSRLQQMIEMITDSTLLE